MREFLHHLYPKLVSCGYRIEIKGEENLRQIESLNKPTIVYFNHLSGDDPVLITGILSQYVNQDRFFLPVSAEYLNPFGSLPLYAIGVMAARKLLGWPMPAIVQSYRLRDERLSDKERDELKNKSLQLGKNLFKNLKNRLLDQENTVVIISPEGHRSNQRLLPAEKGVGAIFQLIKENGIAFPMALSFSNDFTRGLNYNPLNPRQVKVVVDSPLTYDEVIEIGQQLYSKYELDFNKKISEAISHTLMWRLAQILSEEMRGYYSENLIVGTLKGEYQTGIDKNGKVVVRKIASGF